MRTNLLRICEKPCSANQGSEGRPFLTLFGRPEPRTAPRGPDRKRVAAKSGRDLAAAALTFSEEEAPLWLAAGGSSEPSGRGPLLLSREASPGSMFWQKWPFLEVPEGLLGGLRRDRNHGFRDLDPLEGSKSAKSMDMIGFELCSKSNTL